MISSIALTISGIAFSTAFWGSLSASEKILTIYLVDFVTYSLEVKLICCVSIRGIKFYEWLFYHS